MTCYTWTLLLPSVCTQTVLTTAVALAARCVRAKQHIDVLNDSRRCRIKITAEQSLQFSPSLMHQCDSCGVGCRL
jgi:hypothetical protein